MKNLPRTLGCLTRPTRFLESELLSLTKSHVTLQTQLANIPSPSNFIPSSSTTILEENARLKGELSKATFPQGNKSIDDLLSKQRRSGDKGSLVLVPKQRRRTIRRRRPSPHKRPTRPLWRVIPQVV